MPHVISEWHQELNVLDGAECIGAKMTLRMTFDDGHLGSSMRTLPSVGRDHQGTTYAEQSDFASDGHPMGSGFG